MKYNQYKINPGKIKKCLYIETDIILVLTSQICLALDACVVLQL